MEKAIGYVIGEREGSTMLLIDDRMLLTAILMTVRRMLCVGIGCC